MTAYDLSAWPLFRSVLDDPHKAETRPRRCLLLSPLDDGDADVRRHAETVWKYILRPALLDTNLAPHRFEASETQGKVTPELIDAILDDDLVVAVLSHRNPNVYYGLAIAQAAGRPLILMVEEGQETGLDLRGARMATYSLDTDAMFSAVNVKKLQAAIASFNEDTAVTQPFRAGASALNAGGNGGATVYERSRQFAWDRRLSMIREARTRIDIMGIANLAFTLHPDSAEVIRARSGQGVEIRMLQCSPANPGLISLVGQRDHHHLNAIKNEIEAAAEAWKRLCDMPDLDIAITVRRAQTNIPLASAMITDQGVVATPYLSSRVTGESPTMHAMAGSGYHAVMSHEFNQVWSEAVTLFRAEPRHGLHRQAPANGNASPGPGGHFGHAGGDISTGQAQAPGTLSRSFASIRGFGPSS